MAAPRLAYCFEEAFMWHDAGVMQNAKRGFQPINHFESAESKRRLNNLLDWSGALHHCAVCRAAALRGGGEGKSERRPAGRRCRCRGCWQTAWHW